MSAPGRWEDSDISGFIFYFANILITILLIAIFARSVISWFPIDPRSPFVTVLHDVTEPVLGPLRRILPTFGMIDLTPMVAMILLFVVQQAISKAG